MTYLYSFLFCGFVCAVAQIILDNTKLTAGHITSIFVVVGAFLDVFNIYDKIILKVGGGSLVPITSFDIYLFMELCMNLQLMVLWDLKWDF